MDSIASCHCRRTTLIFAAVSLVLTTAYHAWKSVTKRTFVANAAQVVNLYIYPIKSVPGVAVNRVTICKDGGVKTRNITDRSMVILNSEKRMITLRHEPKLALISTSLLLHGDDKYMLKLTGPGMPDPLVIKLHDENLSQASQLVLDFTIWMTPTQGIEVSAEASEWFSSYLNQEGVILVQHLAKFKKRPTVLGSPSGHKSLDFKKGIEYQDGSPMLLTNKKTLKALNLSIPTVPSLKPFEDRSFRPNIVIDKIKSKREEDFLYVRFSDKIVCKNVKLCDRCAIPTINNDKGVKEDVRNDILRKFRSAENAVEKKLYGNNALFGINLTAESSGVVEVGSWIDVSYKP